MDGGNFMIKKYVIITLTILLLVGCAETGEIYTEKYDSSNDEISFTNKIISDMTPIVEDVIDSGESELFHLLLDVWNNVSNEAVSAPADQTYFVAKYIDNYDGDTYRFQIQSAYQISQNAKGSGATITPVDLANYGFSPEEEIKVRALLIDTPEMKDESNGKPQPFAVESKNYAMQLLKNAKTITLAYDKGDKQDRYSRYLMYVWVDSELLSVKLLENGYGKVAYINEPNTTYLEEYKKAEQEAIEQKVGIWRIQ